MNYSEYKMFEALLKDVDEKKKKIESKRNQRTSNADDGAYELMLFISIVLVVLYFAGTIVKAALGILF